MSQKRNFTINKFNFFNIIKFSYRIHLLSKTDLLSFISSTNSEWSYIEIVIQVCLTDNSKFAIVQLMSITFTY